MTNASAGTAGDTVESETADSGAGPVPSASGPVQPGRPAARDELIYEKILANMRDGVVSIDLSGRILTFNEAAGRMLGLVPAETIGQFFAEVFLLEERFEAFNEVVLKAIYEDEATHSHDLTISNDDRRVDLHVSSTFLLDDVGGAVERHGVIVVMSDITEERKRRKLKRLFGEYLDPRIVEQIVARGGGGDERGRRGTMTVTFTDLRDFTGWSERLEPDVLVAMLNRYFSAMTRSIGSKGGITDKFIGDAVMACWGAPFTDPGTQARDACETALDQIARLPELRAAVAADGVPGAEKIAIAVGIGTGEVISGDVGTEQSRNFTVIGNAVNVAARLQDIVKLYGHPILVSGETRSRAGEGLLFREVDRIVLRGRSRPEPVHALIGFSATVSDGEKRAAEFYETALGLYRGRDFAGAVAACSSVLALNPADQAAGLLIRRSRIYEAAPPPEDWNGVWDGPR